MLKWALLSLQALNEEKGIAQTLEAVHFLDPEAFEVILVDGGSQDRSNAAMLSAMCQTMSDDVVSIAFALEPACKLDSCKKHSRVSCW